MRGSRWLPPGEKEQEPAWNRESRLNSPDVNSYEEGRKRLRSPALSCIIRSSSRGADRRTARLASGIHADERCRISMQELRGSIADIRAKIADMMVRL